VFNFFFTFSLQSKWQNLFINYFDAHEWYRWHGKLTAQFDSKARSMTHRRYIEALHFGAKLSDEEKRRLVARYDGETAYMDDYMGQLFRYMEQLGLSDNTIIAITSDHGESFSEHGLYSHGSALYDEQIMTPLILRYPKTLPADMRRTEQISTLDIAPTLLDLAGIPIPEVMQGHSLLPLIENKGRIPERAFSENTVVNVDKQGTSYEKMESMRTPETKWIETTGKVELYDLLNDPKELRNLSTKKPDKANACAKQLRHWRETFPPFIPANEGLQADDQTIEQLNSTGYMHGPTRKQR